MLPSPLEQFEITLIYPLKIYGLNISLTNFTLFLFIVFLILMLFFSLSLYKSTIIPNNWQTLNEIFYEFTIQIIKDTLGRKGEFYFPLIFVLHIFILTCNLLGMIPYGFTLTSHIIFTFGCAFSIFFGINVIGIWLHGRYFFNIFLPNNIPTPIVPLIVTIEIVSYFLRVITLSLRLFANMMSSHILLKIVASFSWFIFSKGGWFIIFHLIPFILLFILMILEFGIAILQAYIFTLLFCIYLNDVLESH